MNKLLITVFLIFGLISNLLAQLSYYAPYGFGLRCHQEPVRMIGMGYAGGAVADSMSLNTENPALWQGFLSTSMQGQISNTLLRLPDTGFESGSALFTGFAFKFPVGRRIGVALGLRPLARMSAEKSFEDSVQLSPDVIYNSIVKLHGGISEFFIGSGFRLNPQTSLGLRFQFLFGTYVKDIETTLTGGTAMSSYFSQTTAINGTLLTLGYWTTLTQHRLNLGLTLEQRLGCRYYTQYDYYHGPDSATAYRSIPYPIKVNFALSKAFQYGLALNADFGYHIVDAKLFEKFALLKPVAAQSGISLRFGLEKSPVRTFAEKFYQRLFYRIGGFYRTEPFYSGNVSVSEVGVTAGLGIPFFHDLNRLDFALTYSQRQGFLDDVYGPEHSLTFQVGFTSGEPWFIRYKKR